MISGEPQPVPTWVRLRSIVFRWLITTLAIAAAVLVVPGISFVGPGWQLGIVALVFGLINIALRPILTLLTCPLILLTLGLFSVVLNAALLLLTASFAESLGIAFQIEGFGPAFWGALIISLVSLVLNALAGETPVHVVVQRNRNE